MIKHLRKVGNSSALIMDKAIMELAGLEEGGEVQLVVSNGSLVITPARPRRAEPQKFAKALDRVVSRRKSALKKLGE